MTSQPLEEMTVNAVVERYPATIRAFTAFGIDACCGGARTLRDVATRHGLDLTRLVNAVAEAARGPEEARAS
jgi:regulator of cell morphogenesis and NO signaling